MEEFLTSYGLPIVIVLAVVAVLIILFKKGATKQMNDVLFYLVMRAEQEYGNSTGELKYAAVVSWLYERIPSLKSWIFSKKQINDMIEAAVIRMKQYLSENGIAKEDLQSKQTVKGKELELLMGIIENLKKDK